VGTGVTLAILCSGQGAQHAAMFELLGGCAAAQGVFAEASAILGQEVRQWTRTATAVQLHANQFAQLLCCTQALAAWAALSSRGDLATDEVVLAGYSAGELASWGCAGLIAPTEVLRLAIARAQVMDQAAGADTGLASVRGMTRSALEALCSAYGCEIAIVLGEDSFIVGGARADLAELTRQALARGAQRSAVLPIAVAAHTSRLTAASAAFRQRLAATTVAPKLTSAVRLLSGLDGDVVRDVQSGLDKLARQISRPIDWQACLTACREAGAVRALELGPGRALSNMAREALPEAHCRSLEEFRTLEGVHKWLREDRGHE
jgi:[acyl-carrier-protein] S-malonyltransferase